jgi:phage terminase small subunit
LAELTAKQAAFVREYLVDRNATQAAIRAGYSDKTAHQIGAENLRKPEIAAAIAKAETKLQDKADVSVQDVVSGLLIEAKGLGLDTTPAARVSAWVHLGKHFGMWKEAQPADKENTKPEYYADIPEDKPEEWQTQGNA